MLYHRLAPKFAQMEDPVRARRARMARLAGTGQQLGYLLFGLAVAGFVAAAITGFPQALVNAIVGCLVAGSVVLAPAIVVGYGVRAAERDDRAAGR